MKELPRMNTKIHSSLLFISGIIIGASAFLLVSFTTTSLNSAVSGKVSVQEAQSLSSKYIQQAAPANSVIRGVAINREQLEAMNHLAEEIQGLAGFRVYMGMDNNNAPVGLVVGIDNEGRDNSGAIYKTSGASSGPCPTICDVSSSIISK